jgi:PhzF family phenazine biosynthesis protein
VSDTTIYQVDAFTDRPFTGNPAGVCVLERPADASWMQAVALEMNVAETAFLHPEADGWRLRWFTPAVEIDLCGHATLASAHVLWETGRLAPEAEARFHTRSGLLTAERRGSWIELDFPSLPVRVMEAPEGLAQALGVEPVQAGRSRDDLLVEVASEAVVRGCAPDFARLRKVPTRGVIVTSRATTPGFDFVSRFFAPAVGIDEDPVTGSAHCALVPYWAERLGRTEFTALQVSPRSGVLRLRLQGDRVRIAGQSVTVLRCELLR